MGSGGCALRGADGAGEGVGGRCWGMGERVQEVLPHAEVGRGEGEGQGWRTAERVFVGGGVLGWFGRWGEEGCGWGFGGRGVWWERMHCVGLAVRWT